jgi:hypothetical protein
MVLRCRGGSVGQVLGGAQVLVAWPGWPTRPTEILGALFYTCNVGTIVDGTIYILYNTYSPYRILSTAFASSCLQTLLIVYL